MAISTNSLYPPIVDTYMPAFIVNGKQGTCRIYFSLSRYNSPSEIKSIWVTVNNQYTNRSVVANEIELKVFDIDPQVGFNKDSERDGDDKYYIDLIGEDIQGGWSLNQFYKVQIRFCSAYRSEFETDQGNLNLSMITNKDALFSEWSTVCLIQGIQQPVVKLNNFDVESEEKVIFTAMDNVIVGRVEFEDEEQLEGYQIKIYNRENPDKIIYDSGIIYTNEYNPNEINHFINYSFIEGEQYDLDFHYITQGLYEENKTYSFSIIGLSGESLNATIAAETDEDEGCIKIHVKSDKERYFGNLTIRRTSNKSNFSIWEDVFTTAVMDENYLDLTWYDYTIESGIWYKYCVQKRNAKGDRGLIVQIEEPIMITLQDMFLTRADRQIKIKFNPQISSFKRVVSDSVTQTLGSKYPFIKRNSNMNYRQFSISGLISYHAGFNSGCWNSITKSFDKDKETIFTKDELYLGYKDLYAQYNQENRINEYNDFSLERFFREKVMDFLYEHNVKLFRSPSEGNILVKLTDISLSPEKTLGRMVYSFSATAHEIDEINFDNLEKYGIQKVGECKENIIRTFSQYSQYNNPLPSINDWINIKAEIQNQIDSNSTGTLKQDIVYFNKLNLHFTSPPYLINTEGEVPKKVTTTTSKNENTVLGYLIRVNEVYVIVGPSGYYTLNGEDIRITSLEILGDRETNLNIIMDYNIIINEYENNLNIAEQILYYSRVGQLRGWEESTQSLIKLIKDKTDNYYENWYQRLFSLNRLKIEAEPNTVFNIKDASNKNFKRYLVGATGLLDLESEDFGFEDFYCEGIHLDEKEKIQFADGESFYKNERTKDLEYENCITQKYKSIEDILNPVKNGVYLLTDNSRIIYFKNNWYPFSKNDDVIIPSQFLIDYFYELEKGKYNV